MESSAVQERSGGLMAQPLKFQPTQPRVIRGAGEGDRAALALLCQWYWYPIYSFLRRQGTGALDACDVTQGFFAWILGRKGQQDLAKVNLERGRFRSWLCACAKHYLLNEIDRARAKRNGGESVHVSIDSAAAEDRFQLELRQGASTEADADVVRIVDREVALIVVERALARLQQVCRSREMITHFEELRRGVRRTERSIRDDAALAALLGTKVGNLRKNRSEVRRRFRGLLREEVGALVGDSACIDDELRHLRDAL